MYSKVVPAFIVISSLLVPTLSLAIPQRAELERRDLGAGSVETLEVREPMIPRRTPFRVLGARNNFSFQNRFLNFGGRNRGPLLSRVRSAFDNVRRFMPPMGRRIRARELGDLEDLSARDIIDDVLELDARDLGDDVEELDARYLVDEEDGLVLRSLIEELDDLEARALFDDLDDLEAREIGESLDELD